LENSSDAQLPRPPPGFPSDPVTPLVRFGFAMNIEQRQQIIQELKIAYGMELETVQNYLANSVDLDGVRAEEIKKSLAADIQEELNHANLLAKRIKVLEGRVPGSLELNRNQKSLQPPEDSTDVITVIRGVIEAEEGAIEQYDKIIQMCDGVDFVTQDMVIEILSDEQEHRRQFVGFLSEYERSEAKRAMAATH
jgi:bacterioferritin